MEIWFRIVYNSQFFGLSFSKSDNSEDLDDSTTLKVHFKDLTCIKYRRDMYMTWDGLFGEIPFLIMQHISSGLTRFRLQLPSEEFSAFVLAGP